MQRIDQHRLAVGGLGLGAPACIGGVAVDARRTLAVAGARSADFTRVGNERGVLQFVALDARGVLKRLLPYTGLAVLGIGDGVRGIKLDGHCGTPSKIVGDIDTPAYGTGQAGAFPSWGLPQGLKRRQESDAASQQEPVKMAGYRSKEHT